MACEGTDVRRQNTLMRLSTLLLLICLSLPVVADDAHQYYESALRYFHDHDYASAVIELKNALKLEPGNLPARILIGRSLLRNGDPEGAEQDLRRARADGADVSLILLPLGQSYLLQRKFKQLLSEIRSGQYDTPLETGIYLLRGRAQLELGQLTAAEDSFSRARALQPGNAAPLFGLALVRLRQARYEETRTLIEQARKLEPDNPEGWYALGALAQQQDHLQEAITDFSKALAIEPRHRQARKARAAALMDSGDNTRARVDVDNILKHDPYDPQVNYLNALLLMREGKLDEARSRLNAIEIAMNRLDRDFLSKHGPSLLLTGVIALMKNRLDDARKYFERYIRLFPKHPGSRKLLGEVYLRQGLPDKAVAMLEIARGMLPRDARIYDLLGQAYLQKKRYQDATHMYEQATRLDPSDANLRARLGISRMAAGDRQQAIADLKAALDVPKPDPRTALLLASLQLQEGDFPSARDSAAKLMAKDPGRPEYHNLSGSALLGLGRLPEARMAFDKALALQPDFLPARINLARVDLREGRLAEAKTRLESVLKQVPNHPDALRGLATIAEKQGKPDEAIAWLDKLAVYAPDNAADLFHRAELKLRIGKPDQALEIARQLDKLTPTELPVLDLIGRAQMALGQKTRAAATYRSMYGFAREQPEWLVRIARRLITLGELESARYSLEVALKQDPAYLPARTTRVNLEVRAGRLKQARILAVGLRKDYPHEPVGNALLGDVLIHQQDYAGAAAAFRKALMIKPSTTLVLSLSQAEQRAGKGKRARTVLRNWLKSHPGDTVIRRRLAGLLRADGEPRQALKEYRLLLKGTSQDPVLLNNIASIYISLDDPVALETARKAYAIDPTHPAIADTLGWALVRQGQADAGLKYLREAQSRLAGQPDINYHLAVALSQLGRKDEAIQALHKALDPKRPFAERTAAQKLMQRLQAR